MPVVSLEQLRPLPVATPTQSKKKNKPPSTVYTSPETLEWVKVHNKDYESPTKVAPVPEEPPAPPTKDKKPKEAKNKQGNGNQGKRKASGAKAVQSPKAKAAKEAPEPKEPEPRKTQSERKKEKLQKQQPHLSAPRTRALRDKVNAPKARPLPREGELGVAGKKLPVCEGREGFECAMCYSAHGDPEDQFGPNGWVFCLACLYTLHVECVRALGSCTCGFRYTQKYF